MTISPFPCGLLLQMFALLCTKEVNLSITAMLLQTFKVQMQAKHHCMIANSLSSSSKAEPQMEKRGDGGPSTEPLQAQY